MWKIKVTGLIFVSVIAITACINPQDNWSTGIIFNHLSNFDVNFKDSLGEKDVHYLTNSDYSEIKYRSTYDNGLMVVIRKYYLSYGNGNSIPEFLIIADSSKTSDSLNYRSALKCELIRLIELTNTPFDISLQYTDSIFNLLESIDVNTKQSGWIFWTNPGVVLGSDEFIADISSETCSNLQCNGLRCTTNVCIDMWDGCGIDIKYELPESTITNGVLSIISKNKRIVGLSRNRRMKSILNFTSSSPINNSSKMLYYDLRGQKLSLRHKCISQGFYLRLDTF